MCPVEPPDKPAIVHASIRDAENPLSEKLRASRFVLTTGTEQVYSVDKYVWPIREELGRQSTHFDVGVPGAIPLVVFADAAGRSDRVCDVLDRARLPPVMLCLGFDVADEVFVSGLLDCEYTDEELARLRPVWAPRLNRYHLFGDRRHAQEFRVLSDQRVPEHAPFYVYELWTWPGRGRP